MKIHVYHLLEIHGIIDFFFSKIFCCLITTKVFRIIRFCSREGNMDDDPISTELSNCVLQKQKKIIHF